MSGESGIVSYDFDFKNFSTIHNVLELSHTKLHVYTISREFVPECYKASKLLPPDERFIMVQQLRRAALSVHLNIVEGSSRKSLLERKRYYEISRGSLVEIDALIDTATDLGYFSKQELGFLGERMIACFKILSKLISQ